MKAISGALWRRHWLELRGGLTVAAIATAVLCLVFPALVGIGIEDHELYQRVSPWLQASVGRRAELGTETFAAWGAHVATTTVAAIMLWLFLAGTGIRTNSLTPGHPSLIYTLTLPVSRPSLIWTRFACGTAAAAVLFGAMLAINAVVLRVAGWPVPLTEMARVTLLALGVVIVVMATLGSLTMVWSEGAGVWAMTIALAAAFFTGWQWLVGIVTSELHAPLAGAAAITVFISLALAGTIAERKDF